MKDHKTASCSRWIDVCGPLVEKVEGKLVVAGVINQSGVLQASTSYIPHALARMQSLHCRPLHAKWHIKLKEGFGPRLVHLVARKERS